MNIKKLLLIPLLLSVFAACNTAPAPEKTAAATEALFETRAFEYIKDAVFPAPEPAEEPTAATEEAPEITVAAEAAETTEAERVYKRLDVTADHDKPAALTKEALLSDFDYFAGILEENYPFYGAARRKFGVDLRTQTAAARAAVEKINTAGGESRILSEFNDIISNYIVAPTRNMGHMISYQYGSQSHKIQYALIKWDATFDVPWYPNLYDRHLLGMFTSPAAIRYYGDPLKDTDVESFIKSVLQTPEPNNVAFDILRPGHTAYMIMRSMNNANYDADGALIAEFLGTIGDFEHLIIDLRGNRGGSASNFLQHVVSPLIDEPASFSYYVFFKGGSHNMLYDEIYLRDLQWQSANRLVLHADDPRFPTDEILPSLTEHNAADFAELSCGFRRGISVLPSADRRAFRGRVWILIDGRSISAAEISAALAKESGFATLVGAPTGGMFGGYTAAFIGLPNTGAIIRYDYGYVTDLRGRPLEELGVAPDVYNFPGMDALETALALIGE